jgi:hypothetical protein
MAWVVNMESPSTSRVGDCRIRIHAMASSIHGPAASLGDRGRELIASLYPLRRNDSGEANDESLGMDAVLRARAPHGGILTRPPGRLGAANEDEPPPPTRLPSAAAHERLRLPSTPIAQRHSRLMKQSQRGPAHRPRQRLACPMPDAAVGSRPHWTRYSPLG